jgi:uncharacterized protein YjdB
MYNGILPQRVLNLLAFVLLLASCQREQDWDGAPDIKAKVESEKKTRTSLSVDESGAGTIYWNSADQIDVFFGTTKAEYVSQNSSEEQTAIFKTTDNVGWDDFSSTNIWGLYPANSSSTCDGSSVTTTLPSTQYGVPGTFDDDLFLAVAHSSTPNLQFYNVCGGIKFNMVSDDITQVTFRGNNNEDLAGTVSISFVDGLPQATVVNGVKEITLTPKTGNKFVKESDYYITLLPGTLSGGFTMTFTAEDGTVGTLNYTDASVTIKRSVFARKGSVDVYAAFEDERQPNTVIYYTSSDGEVVTPYKTDVFGANIVSNEYVGGRGVITFDGVVTSIGADAFSMIKSFGESSHLLTSIVIPDSVTSIGAGAFNLCYELTSINIPDSVSSIGSGAFYRCSALTSIEIPSTVSSIGDGAFMFCSQLSSVTIYATTPPSSVTWQTFSDTNNCPIYVPAESVDAYKTEWSDYANRIYALGEMHEAVDLGLSSGLKWASCNLGASKPEEYGDYYAWGETVPKDNYDMSTYLWLDNYSITKYLYYSYGYSAIDYDHIDNKTVLDLSDDAAQVNWGGDWRMPTRVEMKELMTECTWKWDQKGETEGLLVTGKNGNSIFLPAAGARNGTTIIDVDHGGYWTSSICYPFADYSMFLDFYNRDGSIPMVLACFYRRRFDGLPIRPVYGKFVKVQSLSLNKSNLTLNVGDTEELTTQVTPSNATPQDFAWLSSDYSIVTVDEGEITAVAPGTVTITVWSGDGEKSATCTVTVTADTHEAVDLGLPSGVKWATCNIGASSPEEYGDYFAWGEAEPKNGSSHWSNYTWCNGSSSSFTKYNIHSDLGTVDHKIGLDLEDDAAHVNWGGNWRMPTMAELEELHYQCTWTWTTQGGKNGYRVTGPNGNSIFLPASGYWAGSSLNGVGTVGASWSSTLWPDESVYASLIIYNSGTVSENGFDRVDGMTIRPVCAEYVSVEGVSLNKSSLSLMEGESEFLDETISPSNATEKSVSWSSDNPSVATASYWHGVTAVSPGTATITAWSADGQKTATCTVTVTADSHEAVDLGLSVKWATCNLGANEPEEYGDCFAWGETSTKSSWYWNNYVFFTGYDSENRALQSKYITDSKYGTVDGRTQLDLSDDAARKNWGGGWRMPTSEEFSELWYRCTWTWTSQDGKNGYLIRSPRTLASIFLPAAGWEGIGDVGTRGLYWSSTLCEGSSADATALDFDQNDVTYLSYFVRCTGLHIRPVREE